MAKQARGTKRTCQNGECGARFYDLERDPIICPICNSKYVIASAPLSAAAAAAAAAADERARKAKKAELEDAVSGDEAVVVEGDEASEIEADDSAAAEGDETFLEETEEEGGDMSNIIGGPVAEGDEEV